MNNYRMINRNVMLDTQRQYEAVPELVAAVKESISRQYMVAEKDNIDQPAVDCHTRFIVSPKRSFEAAKAYLGKKVTVLNFANNHSVGGAPFSAGAQEESLCRCSTLYPCLQAMNDEFYRKHQHQYAQGLINHMGNDDLIYTPDVVVFKSDERKEVIEPKMLPQDEWYKVNVITCAAPELRRGPMPADYEARITSRIKKILDVAAREDTEVLILGAWGCGAFRNPPETVSRVFFSLLKNYNFETVEFAITSDRMMDIFANASEHVDCKNGA